MCLKFFAMALCSNLNPKPAKTLECERVGSCVITICVPMGKISPNEASNDEKSFKGTK